MNIQKILETLVNIANNKDIEIEKGFELWLKHIKANRRIATYNYYLFITKELTGFLNSLKIYHFNQINTNVINEIINHNKRKGLKPVSINKQIIALKSIINYLVELEIIDEPKIKFKKLKEDKPEIQTISNDDLIRCINYLNNKKPIRLLCFLLMITTGVRRTELINIKISNINLNQNTIYLERTKNGYPRNIYIVDNLIKQLIINQIKNTDISKCNYLFNIDNIQSTTSFVDSIFYKLRHNLNIPKISAHKLRHTFATSLIENGANFESIRLLLGHETTEMTKRYIHLKEKKLQEDCVSFNPLKALNL